MAEADAHGGETRRDFILLLGNAMAVVGAAALAWPLIDSLSPAADTKAASTTEVDLSPIKEGQAVTVKWRGSPVFIRYRTKEEIERAVKDDKESMPDPQPDEARHQEGKPQWLILVGVCTHLAASRSASTPATRAGPMAGGSAPATARNTTRRAASAKDRHPRTSWFPTTVSSATPKS